MVSVISRDSVPTNQHKKIQHALGFMRRVSIVDSIRRRSNGVVGRAALKMIAFAS